VARERIPTSLVIGLNFAENDDVLVLCTTVAATSGEHDGDMNAIDDTRRRELEDVLRKDVEDKIKRFNDRLHSANFLDSIDPRPGKERVDELYEELYEERHKQLESNHRQVCGESQAAPSAVIDRRVDTFSSGSGEEGVLDGHVNNIQGLDKVDLGIGHQSDRAVADDSRVSQRTRALYVRT
jgi:hypothetical protein